MTGTISSKGTVVREKVIGETEEFVIIAVYLFIVFSALLFLKSAILKGQGGIWVPWGFAAVKAALVAKFVLIARAMHLGERFRSKPLIWEATYRSLVFLLVVAVLTVIEEAIVSAIHGRPILDAISEIGGGAPMMFIATAVIVFLVFLPLSASYALGEVMGQKALFFLFFVERRHFEAVGRVPERESATCRRGSRPQH